MPNYVRNDLKLRGDESQIEKFINGFVERGFEDTVPMPSDLYDVDYHPTLGDAVKKSLQGKRLTSKEEAAVRENRDLFEVYISNMERYGACCWYDWAYETWGTKWNAVEKDVFGGSVFFLTAWHPPVPWMLKASKKFPSLEFDCFYVDEEPAFAGRVIVKSGEIIKKREIDPYEYWKKYQAGTLSEEEAKLVRWIAQQPDDESLDNVFRLFS